LSGGIPLARGDRPSGRRDARGACAGANAFDPRHGPLLRPLSGTHAARANVAGQRIPAATVACRRGGGLRRRAQRTELATQVAAAGAVAALATVAVIAWRRSSR